MDSLPQFYPGYKINPDYDGKDCAAAKVFFEYLNQPEENWGAWDTQPKKETDPQIWTRKIKSQGGENVSSLIMNCRYLFKDMPPAKLHAMVADPNVKIQW